MSDEAPIKITSEEVERVVLPQATSYPQPRPVPGSYGNFATGRASAVKRGGSLWDQAWFCLGVAGLAPFVGGNFDSLAFSPTAVVYADWVINQARRFARGFAWDDEALGLAEIAEVGPGGDYFTAESTLTRFRELAFTSPIFPRLSLEAWQGRGGPRAEDLLRRHTVELMASHAAPPDRDALVERGEAWIRRRGV